MEVFAILDENKRGYLTERDFIQVCCNLCECFYEETFAEIFRELDVDEDGKLFEKDFETIQGQFSKMCDSERTKPREVAARSESFTSNPGYVVSKRRNSNSRYEYWISTDKLDVDLNRFFPESQEQICDLYHQLYEAGFGDQLSRFEDVIVAIIRDVRQQMSDKERLERLYNRDKEQHARQLHQMEEEMEMHTQKVEARVQKSERDKFEAEKEDMRLQFESEISDLQSNLKRLQQIDSPVKCDKFLYDELKSKYDGVCQENRNLKRQMTDCNTNLALMRSEATNARTQIESVQYELEREKINLVEYVKENDNLSRQITLLQAANKKLHDTNDDQREALEMARSSQKRPNSLRYHRRSSIISIPGRNGILRSVSTGSRTEYIKKYLQELAADNALSPDASTILSGPVESPSLAEELSITGSTLQRSNSSNGRSLLPTQDSCEVDSLPEDIDSGHFTIQDIHDDDDDEEYGGIQRSRSHKKGQQDNYEESDRYNGSRHNNHREYSKKYSTLEKYPAMDMLDPHDEVAMINSSLTRSCSGCSRSSSRLSRQSSDCNSNPGGRKMNKEIQQPQKPINQEPERVFKIVLAGDAAVGKSSFIMRLCKNKFISSISSTLGVDFQTKTLEVDGRVIALQLWDTAGQERFRSIAKSYFRRADGVLLLYDVTYERSFLSVRDWLEAIEDGAQKPIPIMLVGNKSDLRAESESTRTCVKTEDGQKLAKDFQGLFIEASAKDGRNINEAVTELSRMLMTNEDLEVHNIGLTLKDVGTKKKSPCCNL